MARPADAAKLVAKTYGTTLMRKLESLRKHMMAALAHRGLKDNPADLHFAIPSGSTIAQNRGGSDRGFEYRYTLSMGIFDCAWSFDEIILPLMIWVERWQPELLSLAAGAGGIAWEVDQLDDGKSDILVKIPITETVFLKIRPDGGHDLTRPEEPVPFALEPATPLHRVYLDGELIVACAHEVE